MRKACLLIAGLVVSLGSPAARSQVACQAGLSLPAPAIDRNPLIFNTPADLGLAVSENRIAETSNDKVQLRCRSTGGKLVNLGIATTLPLRGADPASGAFVTNPAIDTPEAPRRMFDPSVIYDNYDHRFWMVASEDGAPDPGASHIFDVGRIHIAASAGATPNSWTSPDWKRCTWGGDKDPLDIQTQLGFVGTFPDRCSIAVDATYLYICYREGEPPPYDDTIVLVFDKSNILGTAPLSPHAVIRLDDIGSAEFVVDYAIDPGAQPSAYILSRGQPVEDPPGSHHFVYYQFRLGKVTVSAGGASYTAVDYDLGEFAYSNVCSVDAGNYYDVLPNDPSQCQNTIQIDKSATFSELFSAVTRPYHGGTRKIWAVQAVRAREGACGDTQMVLQYYEIVPGVSFTVTRLALADGAHAHDPSLAVNANGDVVITFNRSYTDTPDTNRYPDIMRWTKAYDPNGGQFGDPTLEKAGPAVAYRGVPFSDEANYAVSPYWADFTRTEPDPVMDCQFWSHGLTGFATASPACSMASEKWQSWILRYRVGCPTFAMRGNLDMNLDGELTADDISIYNALASEGDSEMDRTYEGETDVWDFMDFMAEWDDPE